MNLFRKSPARRAGARAPQRGSTMIEVMVSIVILALGMMGMLGMFINSLKISGGAMYRNIATQHAYMMADIVRANLVNAPAYFSLTPAINGTCFSTGCSPSVIPTVEYDVWETQLGALLPAGQGVLCRDSTPAASTKVQSTMSAFMACDNSTSGQMVVKVCWDESRIRTTNAGVANTATTGLGGSQCVYTNI
jgi:type IV pilus assembly protein PilV